MGCGLEGRPEGKADIITARSDLGIVLQGTAEALIAHGHNFAEVAGRHRTVFGLPDQAQEGGKCCGHLIEKMWRVGERLEFDCKAPHGQTHTWPSELRPLGLVLMAGCSNSVDPKNSANLEVCDKHCRTLFG